jgi:diguanylate cyclase
MQFAFQKEKDRSSLSKIIRLHQAEATLDGASATVMTNAWMSISAAAMAISLRGLSAAPVAWLAVGLLVIAARLACLSFMRRRDLVYIAPQTVLALLSAGALASGLVWAALPVVTGEFEPIGRDGGLYMLMCGIGGGAVLMGNGYRSVSLAFALPVLLSVIAVLIIDGRTVAIVLAVNLATMTVWAYRSARNNEQVFIANLTARLKATDLASSLSEANQDMRRTRDRLEILANCDPLTGLANRTRFNATLEDAIDAATSGTATAALLIVDLDRFKTVNDTLGHGAGDKLLTDIAGRLKAASPEAQIVARLGGDEFALLFTGNDAHAQARRNADAICAALGLPVIIDGMQLGPTGASIGIALCPDHATTAADLLICADIALYRAKDAGRRQWCEFEPVFRTRTERQHQIQQELGAALASGQVEAWFQPQVDLQSEAVIGFEALVRWHHPYLGPISPPEIVAAAQATNQSDRLTATVAEAACQLLDELPGLGLPRAHVSINVSPREFELYDVASVLDAVTGAHRIDPVLFEIEITEEAMLDTAVAGEQLRRLEQSGYRLAVDDFGAGHSSLAYLVSLNVDRLKLDRRFVHDIATSHENQEVVGALVGLGQSLSMDVLIEGVETAEEVRALRLLGCREAQGYLFGRPMPASRLPGWVASRHAVPYSQVA